MHSLLMRVYTFITLLLSHFHFIYSTNFQSPPSLSPVQGSTLVILNWPLILDIVKFSHVVEFRHYGQVLLARRVATASQIGLNTAITKFLWMAGFDSVQVSTPG